MKKIFEKIANAYYMRMAKSISKFSELLKRNNHEEINIMVENMPERLIDEYYMAKAKKGQDYKVIIARGNYREIKTLFENLCEAEIAEAEKFYYETFRGNYDNGPLKFAYLLFKYGTKEDVLKAIPEHELPSERIISRGDEEEINLFIEEGKSVRGTEKGIEEYLIAKGDEALIKKYLQNARTRYVGDELASLAMSFGLTKLIVSKKISEEIANKLIDSGNKEVLLAYAPYITACGVEKILEREDELGFTQEEKENLIKRMHQLENRERFHHLMEANR
jgi:hypothetical protein